jgi:hypothetical protein
VEVLGERQEIQEDEYAGCGPTTRYRPAWPAYPRSDEPREARTPPFRPHRRRAPAGRRRTQAAEHDQAERQDGEGLPVPGRPVLRGRNP